MVLVSMTFAVVFNPDLKVTPSRHYLTLNMSETVRGTDTVRLQ